MALGGLRVGVGGDVLTRGIECRKVHRALEEHRETLLRQEGELDGWEWHQHRKRHYAGLFRQDGAVAPLVPTEGGQCEVVSGIERAGAAMHRMSLGSPTMFSANGRCQL